MSNKSKSRKRKSVGIESIALKTAALVTAMLRFRNAVIATRHKFPIGGEVSPNNFEFIIPKKTVTASFDLSELEGYRRLWSPNPKKMNLSNKVIEVLDKQHEKKVPKDL